MVSSQSRTWYRKAARAAPAALVFLSAVLARQGRLAQAKRCHREATRAPEDDRLARDEAYFNLGLVFSAERRYREALASFDRAIALDPKYTAALEAQADVQSALKVEVPEEHAKHWREMLDALDPNPATAHELVRAYTGDIPADLAAGWCSPMFSQDSLAMTRPLRRFVGGSGWRNRRTGGNRRAIASRFSGDFCTSRRRISGARS